MQRLGLNSQNGETFGGSLIAWLTVMGCLAAALFTDLTIQAQEQAPIRIGASLALSGKLAYMGKAEANGAMLAIEEINSAGGVGRRPLKLILEDNLGEPRTAVTGVKKLLDVDRIDILLSAFTHITASIKDLAAERGKLMLYQSGVKWIAEEHPLIFRDYYNMDDSGRLAAKGIKESNYRKVGIIGEMNEACQEFISAFKQETASGGISIVREEVYNPGETDFRNSLLRQKVANPSVIVACVWRDTAIFMRQLKELGLIGIPTFHLVAHNSPEADTFEMRRLYEENRTVSTFYGLVESDESSEQVRFIDRYRRRFGEVPRSDAAFFYDDVRVLALALKNCVSVRRVDQRCVADVLLKTNYEGVAGPLRFNEYGVASRPVFLVRVENGKWVRVD